MINKMRKQISLLAAIAIVISLFSFVQVFADNELPIDINIALSDSVEKNGISVGKVLKPSIQLDFDDADIIGIDGIIVMQFGLKFDPEVLELLDPETLEPIEIDEKGNPLSGKMYKFDEIGSESCLSVTMKSDGKTIVPYYIATPADGSADIYSTGDFMHFAFRVKADLAVEEYITTVLEIVDPYIGGNNTEAKADVKAKKKYVKITPPFTMEFSGESKQNCYINIAGREYIDENSEYPLVLTITKDGENIEEPMDIPLNITFYDKTFYLDEAKYEPGTYKITLTHGVTSISKTITVAKKDEPVVVPEPDEPDEDDGDDTKNEDSSSDNDSSNTGTNTDTNTGNNNGSNSSNNSTSTKPNTDTSKGTESNDTYKPTVKYPSDIESHWAIDNVKYVYDNSLMNGYEDGTFGPDNSITRAEFVTVMARLLGLSEAPESAAHFADASSHWAKGYIGALAANGIVGGVSDTEFAPDENITREQIAAILSRAFELTDAEASAKYADDAQISDWAYESVYKVFAAGYMKGDTNNNFNPLASATRAEVATIIYRLHTAE